MRMSRNNKLDPKARYQFAGWILFVICAICFIASSWINKDVPAFIGSVVFLAACVAFLIAQGKP